MSEEKQLEESEYIHKAARPLRWVKDKDDHTAWYLDLNFHGLIDDLRVSRQARETFEALGGP